MRDHRKLKAFTLADQLVRDIYAATATFPHEEIFALTAQMRRAAVSVPANIVEGCARNSLKEYLNFLNMAFGSLRELGYYVHLAHRLGYLPETEKSRLANLHDETCRVLSGLMQSLRRRQV